MSRNRSNGTRSKASDAFIKARQSYEQFPEAGPQGWRESTLGTGRTLYDALAMAGVPSFRDGHLSSHISGPNPYASRFVGPIKPIHRPRKRFARD